MAVNIEYGLDEVYETLGLLYFGGCAEIKKADVISELDHLGLSGAGYYDVHFKMADRYIEVFQQHREASPADALFFDDGDHGLFLILAAILCTHKSWLDGSLPAEEAELRSALVKMIRGSSEGGTPADFEGFTALLNEKKLTDGSKWKLLMLLLNPRRHLQELAGAIQKNRKACRLALEAVQKQADHLLQQYEAAIRGGRDKSFAKLEGRLLPDARVFPALVTPLMIMLPTHANCYYGLLHWKALKDAEKHLLMKNFCCAN